MKLNLSKGNAPPSGYVFALTNRARSARYSCRYVTVHLVGARGTTAICGAQTVHTLPGEMLYDGDRLCRHCAKEFDHGN